MFSDGGKFATGTGCGADDPISGTDTVAYVVEVGTEHCAGSVVADTSVGTVTSAGSSPNSVPAGTDFGTDDLAGNATGGAEDDDIAGLADGVAGANPGTCANGGDCAGVAMVCTNAGADFGLTVAVIGTATDTDLANYVAVDNSVGATCFHN